MHEPGHYFQVHDHHVLAQEFAGAIQEDSECVRVIQFLFSNLLLTDPPTPLNSFFLAIAILQFLPKFSTISPGLVILPLIVVLGITAIKDGYEDIKRHQSDRRVNHAEIHALSGGDWVNPNAMEQKTRTFVRGIVPKSRSKPVKSVKNTGPQDIEMLEHGIPAIASDAETPNGPHWKKTMWEDVRVGDFVKIMDNESFPADILICATSEDENVAFIETKNLDGETNLKSRNAVPVLTHLRTAADCARSENKFHIDLDRPDTNMYRLLGAVVAGEEKYPLDIQMTMLRGTVLRNTEWAIGIVIFTGEDTKIVLNSGGTPSKRSKVERQMNPQV